jgi:uncharacterized membrane protein
MSAGNRTTTSCRSIIKVLFLSLLFVMFLQSTNAKALDTEVINSYHSDIVINRDATMQVTETINVTSAGNQIRHGIYRDFPTKYKDTRGNNVNVGFEVVEVQRDGITEKYSLENMDNGKRIVIGDEDVLLSPGKYTYKIIYNTHRQLGFFENNDELFWNVTGNGWAFSILKASATIKLPAALVKNSSTLGGYTGIMGSKDKNLQYSISSDGKAVFNTTNALAGNEGLSIFVTFPKGIVEVPSGMDYFSYGIKDNLFAVIILIGALLSLFIYLYGWIKYGRDPKKGTIIPLFTPPKGLSPEDMRYIYNMGYDNKLLTATIINMAVKGVLIIEEDNTKRKESYRISKTGNNFEALTELEKIIAGDLPESMELKQENHAIMTKIIGHLTGKLSKLYSKVYFNNNARFVVINSLLTVAITVIAFAFMVDSISAMAIVPAIILFVPHLFFWKLLKAPTKEGRILMDEIVGFKRFLEVTEKDRLNLLNPPACTPELFEKYLPYALALDVEQKWAEQFATLFSKMADNGNSYSPLWYTGAAWNMHHTANFAHSFNSSFSSAISSASSAPGSSSGSSGVSGGGGGGGGGGGW